MANISVDITGNDKSASSTMDSVGSKASSLSSKIKNMGSGIGKVFGGIQLASLADKIVDFGKESTEQLEDVATETRNLQRVMGGTSEQVSAFAAVSNKLGVNQAALSVAMSSASKQIVNGTSILPKLGIAVKDANGNYLPMADLLPEIAEKFKDTQNSTERAAMASTIFGRAGRQLLPVLGQGKEGLADMEDEARKTGLTLSGSAMASTWKYQQAQISLQESVEGLQVKLGTALYPQLTKLSTVLTTKVLPAIMGFFDWMQKNPAIIADITRVIGPLVAGIALLMGALKAWTIVQGILNVVMDANPIGLIILAVAALIAAVLLIVANWKVIGPWLSKLWSDIWSFLVGVWDRIIAFLRGAIDLGLNLFENFNPLGIVITHFGQIVSFFAALPGRILNVLGNGQAMLDDFGRNIIIGLWNGIMDRTSWLRSMVFGLAGNVVSWAKSALGIHSPSTVFHGIGQNVGQGFANGIASMHGVARRAMSGLVQTPSVASMGLTRAVGGSAGGPVAGGGGPGAGAVYIGTFVGGSASPAQISQELAFRGRWATS